MTMRKLRGCHIAEIWEPVEDKERGIKGSITATMSFDITKPQCDRCTNPNKRVTIQISGRQGGKKIKICMDCLTNLVEGVNIAMQEFKLVRLVLTGLPINDAIEEVLNGDEASTSGVGDLQAALDYMTDMMYTATGDTEAKKQRRVREVESTFKDIEVDIEVGMDE
jgi:transposase-like protein